jgi:hypothetical protein
MEVAVEKLAVICFFLFGISHIVQPRAWVERAWYFVVGGIVIIAVGGLFLFSLASRGELS